MLHESMKRRLAIIGATLVGVAVLALGGWAAWPEKLSEAETEAALRASYSNWRDVRCTKQGSGGWDYVCAYSYLYQGQLQRESILVDVNAKGLTNRSAP
jgi:hypothetical protein